MSLPLSGVRIVAVEQYGAGPFATQHLADLGAEIIKIENFREGGDVGRLVGPHFFGEGDSHFFEAFNRNKSSFTLDLKKEDARQVLLDLVATSDAVFNNLRGDLPAKRTRRSCAAICRLTGALAAALRGPATTT
jgi:crotonobetainyl-CoA:carnitine CoA-transferase CaiB-like acyl-CoA transferase